MTVHYLPNRNRSRVARLEVLVQKGMAYEDALKAVDLTAYELVQELKAMPAVHRQTGKTDSLIDRCAQIIPFAKRNTKARKSRFAKPPVTPETQTPFETLNTLLSFPDTTNPSVDKRF